LVRDPKIGAPSLLIATIASCTKFITDLEEQIIRGVSVLLEVLFRAESVVQLHYQEQGQRDKEKIKG
jgi:hypothetical protein